MIDAVRSEGIKLRTARSNVVLMILATVIPVALTLLLTFTIPLADIGDADLFNVILAGANIGFILLGVLGVLAIGQEYRHTTIRVTFTANPHRVQVMMAKAVVVAATGFVIGTVATAFSYVLGNAVLTSRGVHTTLEGGTQTRALAGSILLFALYGLVGVGLGAIVRATAAAITLLVVWPLLVEGILRSVFPGLGRRLPFWAGQQLANITTTEAEAADALSPRAGGLLFTLFAAALLVVGSALVTRRDA